VIKSLIQLAARTSVQPQWDGRFARRDEPSRAGRSGETWWTNGVDGRLSVRAVYAIVIGLIAAWTVVTIFSNARDVSWRLGSPHNLWEPVLWNVTSAIVGVAVLPLVRRGALLFRYRPVRPLTAAAAFVALALTYSALHIAGMGVLRELAYALGGWDYTFPWSRQIPYELRKDLFNYLAMAVIFWFAERPARAAPVQVEQAAPKVAAAAKPELWLRDGRTSVLIDVSEIVSVSSAGNYVEYELTEQRRHLIRATLQAEEARLAPFGIMRVHRSRLLNLKRIVALQWRPSGDFEVRLDTGETVLGSRRFKAVVAGIAD
jgi:DNA-binding LytR/AlgR family response regulator